MSNSSTTNNVLSVTNSATGQISNSLLNIAQTGVTTGFTGNTVNITSTITTGSGSILNVQGNGINGTASALNINSSSTGAFTNGLARFNGSAAHTGNVVSILTASTAGVGLSITDSASGQTTTKLLSIAQTGVTTGFTGNVVDISGSSTTGSGKSIELNLYRQYRGAALNIAGNTRRYWRGN